jgi:Flp pilus assembly protein CpaB
LLDSVLPKQLLSTRKGTVAIGIGAAVLAGIVLLVYLSQYRHSVNSQSRVVQVLVAKSLIQQGTPGEVVGRTGLFQTAKIPKSQLLAAALVDPTTLRGRVAAVDIFPGQQLTANEFTIGGAAPLTPGLSGNQRAISIPLDAARSVAGQLVVGDHVDVYVGANAQVGLGPTRPIVKLVMQDMYVLAVSGSTITFRATPREAAQLAYAALNATLWLSLRPATGGTAVQPPVVDANALLLSKPPLQVSK